MLGKVRDVARMQGVLMLVLAASMSVPFLLALYYNESASAKAFGGVMIFCVIFGILLRVTLKHSDIIFKSRDGFLVVTITWVFCSLISALPFVISGAIPSITDAVFESCSGFSTTGATILTDVEILPKSILFWRSFTHWLGGMGLLVFVMALLPAWGVSGQVVAYAETPGPTKDKLTAHFTDTARVLYKIYLGMSAAEALLLRIGGMNWFDSLIHTFGSMGTGGFSNYNNSVAHFQSPFIHVVIIVFMILAGMNFNLYFLTGRHGLLSIFKDEEAKFYLKLIGLFSLLIFAVNWFYAGFERIGEIFLNALFQVSTIITTTGFGTDNYDAWPTFSKMLILLLFFVGGCASSTGGGVKCVRVLVCLKMIKRSLSLRLHPKRIAKLSFNGSEMGNETVIKITNFVFTYIIVLVAGTLLLSINNFDFLTCFSAAASCLGNVGPGFNMVGPTTNYALLSDFSKWVCSFLMITGRLELFTVLTLFSRYYWNSNRAK